MEDDNPIDTSIKNNEISKTPVAGFNVHPENINMKGRPHKGHSITETIRAMMDEKPEIKKALGAKILQMAIEGDITAIKTIWNYIDGMPIQKQELGGTDGQPIQLNITAQRGFVPSTATVTSSSETGNAGESAAIQNAGMAQESPKDDNSHI